MTRAGTLARDATEQGADRHRGQRSDQGADSPLGRASQAVVPSCGEVVPVARLWAALLLLAAVFAMHGVQCVAAGSAQRHGSTSVGAAAAVGVPAASVHLGPVAGAMPDHGHGAATPEADADGATGSSGLPAPWHDAHVLAVCLAVLLAGLMVLRAVVLRRGVAIPPVRGSPTPSRWPTGWSRQPRPPTLSALCLLRI
ncbi:DUF6153 family protein [Modestobacter sp. VKM Ac-2978]|uniref:DUF6153 family protein n=1 Tax=Modestobacter sp. VKM Ac-2978 TaxID=3004132 RepID=UPI003FA5B0F0